MTDAPRIMIAAAHKSSGKTVITTGIAAAMAARGRAPACFKKGPDYIDPMWLSAASGRPTYNLDFNVMGDEEIRALFGARAAGAPLALVEANKGLFDGVACDGSDANAALARLLDLPVILVIDTTGMTRGIAPLLCGYRDFDPGIAIAGVVLNKVGGARHEAKLRAAVAQYTDIEVVGSVWRSAALEIGERHLGLTTPAEVADRDALIATIGRVVADTVDLDAVHRIGRTAPDLGPVLPLHRPRAQFEGLRIGIARDAAFGFYYADDLETFGAHGAELIPFDTLSDTHLPEVDGLFIGGGFPEMRMDALSANTAMRGAIRAALAGGMPVYAECGGLMYLCRSLRFGGRIAEMVGAIPADAVMHARPQGRGYVRLEATARHPWPPADGAQAAHEFHYASLEGLPPDVAMAWNVKRGHGIDGAADGIVLGNLTAGFCHLRNTGPSPWIERFLAFVAAQRGARRNGPRHDTVTGPLSAG